MNISFEGSNTRVLFLKVVTRDFVEHKYYLVDKLVLFYTT